MRLLKRRADCLGKKLNAYLRWVLFNDADQADQERRNLVSELAALKQVKETRIPLTLRVGQNELHIANSYRQVGGPVVNVLRARLGLRQISHRFRAAATATAARPRGPVLSKEQIALLYSHMEKLAELSEAVC